jgi:hypothetical protein
MAGGPRAVVAGAALAALVACGGGTGGIPTKASVPGFCAATYSFSQASTFSEGEKAARKLRETGTPKGIPADARRGLVLVVDVVTRSKDKRELEHRYAGLSGRQKKSVAALDGYIAKTC